MNASKTAKTLYMHRNTLNYRLDNFINKTEIDVRKFKGAIAIYLLFKR
ncbi:MAG: helix-turn-helix domain-containing protein [Tenericutes bacterium]|nr:helix-turn-helix domain-containing protein [Mycoplasmatota bacterium]